MAGKGPPPKDVRRRSGAPARGEWVELSPLVVAVLPELPALAEGDWDPSTRLAWEAWRADPVTAMYSIADVSYALDTILLRNSMTASSANEIRLRMDALGLTPKGKRDLRWRVVKEPAPVGQPAGVTALNEYRRSLAS